MGDLPKVIGKDDQKYNDSSEAEHELAAGKHDETPMLFFNLVLGLYLTLLYCYINLELLIPLAILVFSGLILKVEEYYKQLHKAPEIIPIEDQQYNKPEHKVDEPEPEPENIKLEIENVKNTRHNKADKYSQVDDEQMIVIELQAGYDWEEVSNETILQARTSSTSQRNEQKKKNKKKKRVDGIVEGTLEGVLDTTNVVIDIFTGGVFSSTIGYIFWR